MKTQNNPLPFYQLEGDIWTNYKPLWHHNNAHCKNTCCYSNVFYVGTHWFQHKVSVSTTSIVEVKLRNVSDNSEETATINANIYAFGADRFVVISLTIDSGLIGSNYYLAIETNIEKFYSEVFCIKDQVNDRIAVVWNSDCRVGDMVYNDDIRNIVNLDAIVVPSEPEYIQEVVENGQGDEIPTFQKLKQKYTFSCVVPNYLARALSALSLHNNYNIIDRFGGETYSGDFDADIKEVTVKITPEDDGCNTFVEITYVKETLVKTSCCDGELLMYVTEDNIWNENLGNPNEWNVKATPLGTELEHETNPYDGQYSIFVPSLAGTSGDLILQSDYGFSFSDQGEFTFWMRTSADFTENTYIVLSFIGEGFITQRVLSYWNALSSFGFDYTIHNTWQLLTYNLSEFIPDISSGNVTTIVIGLVNTPELNIDLITYDADPES